MNKNPYFLFTLLPIFLLLFAACSDEQGNSTLPVPSVPEGYMAVEIVVPGESDPATRALEAFEECEVQTLDILAFNATDNKFVYHEVGTDIEDHSTAVDGNKKIFYVKVPQDGTYSIYFMVIANAQQQVTDANIAIGTSKEDVMRALTFDAPAPWPVSPGPFTRFPMWGISEEINLMTPSITIAPISLVRSVAKIDVGVNYSIGSDVPAGLGKVFKLEKIYVYNAQNKLMIAPEPGSYNAVLGTPGIPDYSVPATPPFTVPSLSSSAGTSPAMEYLLRDYNTEKIAHTNEIYVAEHAAGSLTGRATNFCLVIGARYGTDTVEGTVTTYYRVDFIKTTRDGSGNITAQDFLPILRNHRYKVNITNVHGRGYDTAAEAFNAMGMNTNLTVEITDNDESLTEFEYDGQYALGVSKGKYEVDKNAHTNVEIAVSTTHEQGWKATVTSGSGWLSITPGTGLQTIAGKSNLKFNVTANGGAERTGKIEIQSGRLFKEITVVQRNINFIEIVGKEDWYVMDSTQTYTFTVKSTNDWKVKVKSDPYNILRTFTTGAAANLSGSPFSFTMENDIVYQTIIDADATLTFYSQTGDFVDYDVPINGKSCFDLGGVYVYHKDQPISQTWYVYSNTPNGVNENSVPPASGQQANPAHTNSCAAIVPQIPGKPWRLPTLTELVAVYNAAVGSGGVVKYGFSTYYWSATSYNVNNARCMYFHNGTQYDNYSKSHAKFRARCVRDK